MNTHLSFLKEKAEVEDLFEKKGWDAVWERVSKGKLSIRTVAIEAAEHSLKLEGRPPLDSFWLSVASVQKKLGIEESVRAEAFLYWLEHHSRSESTWDAGRLGFEALYLLNTHIMSWSTKMSLDGRTVTLAEATMERISDQVIINWGWDWEAIGEPWLMDVSGRGVRTQDTKRNAVVCLIEMLEQTRTEGWGKRQSELAQSLMKSQRHVMMLAVKLSDRLNRWGEEIERVQLEDYAKLNGVQSQDVKHRTRVL
jgi:hypothetical protein